MSEQSPELARAVERVESIVVVAKGASMLGFRTALADALRLAKAEGMATHQDGCTDPEGCETMIAANAELAAARAAIGDAR